MAEMSTPSDGSRADRRDSVTAGSTEPDAAALVHAHVSGGTGALTVHNPAHRNAITAPMWRSIASTLRAWSSNDEVRIVTVTGSGAHFSSGADIVDLEEIVFGGEDLIPEAVDALEKFPRPTIAVIRGSCVGGGWDLASACDFRLATPDARLGVTPAVLGVVYPETSIRRLVSIVGRAWARSLLLTGEILTAERALSLGLVTEVVNIDMIDEAVDALIAELRRRSSLSIAATKHLLEVIDDPAAFQEAHAEWTRISRSSGETAEGRRAFLERRPPEFPWREAATRASSGIQK